MENNNRSHRYRDDNRSSSNERNYDNNWDRTRNRSSDDWREDDNRNRNVYSSDRERDYWKNPNDQLNDLNWNTNSNYNSDYNRNNDYNRNYNNDSNRNFNNDHNRGNRNDYRNDNWRRNNNNDNYNNRYRNEGWRDNYRNEDRDWWDRTKDEVASWFGDDDAKRRRDRDETNNGQHRGKGPKNYTRSQERIKEDVSDKLSDDSFLDASDIEVEVKGNEVTLTGQVDSRYSKHRAEDLAEDVTGVSHVQNNLRVVETTSQENRQTNSNYNTTTGSANNTTKNKKEATTL